MKDTDYDFDIVEKYAIAALPGIVTAFQNRSYKAWAEAAFDLGEKMYEEGVKRRRKYRHNEKEVEL